VKTISEIYGVFGKCLNNVDNQSKFKIGNRELIFYRCNQSQNRGDLHLDNLHATVCITSIKNIDMKTRDSILCNGNVKETMCSLDEVLISINIYNNLDTSLDIALRLKSFFNTYPIQDYFNTNGISIKTVKNVRRLDAIVKEKFEYRSSLELLIQTSLSNIESEISTWNTVDYGFNGCLGLQGEGAISRLDIVDIVEDECKNK